MQTIRVANCDYTLSFGSARDEAMKRQMLGWALANMKLLAEGRPTAFLDAAGIIIGIYPNARRELQFIPIKGAEEITRMTMSATSEEFDHKSDHEDGAVILSGSERMVITAILCPSLKALQEVVRKAEQAVREQQRAAPATPAPQQPTHAASRPTGEALPLPTSQKQAPPDGVIARLGNTLYWLCMISAWGIGAVIVIAGGEGPHRAGPWPDRPGLWPALVVGGLIYGVGWTLRYLLAGKTGW